MKFRQERPFANVDVAVKKLLEMANGIEPDHAGPTPDRHHQHSSMATGGNGPEYASAVKAAVDRGYMTLHTSGAYMTFTQAGADLFA
jgi:hypothetical protein